MFFHFSSYEFMIFLEEIDGRRMRGTMEYACLVGNGFPGNKLYGLNRLLFICKFTGSSCLSQAFSL